MSDVILVLFYYLRVIRGGVGQELSSYDIMFIIVVVFLFGFMFIFVKVIGIRDGWGRVVKFRGEKFEC